MKLRLLAATLAAFALNSGAALARPLPRLLLPPRLTKSP